MNYNKMFSFAVQRLREPSTYAGLAAVLAFMSVPDASSWAHNLTELGVGLSGVIAMFMKESGAPDK